MGASSSPYARFISAWEFKLASSDPNRRPHPFAFGWTWFSELLPGQVGVHDLHQAIRAIVRHSQDWFSAPLPTDYRLEGQRLTFTSPVRTPWPENNVVHADYYPSRRARGRAVLLIPQWNADERSHQNLALLLSLLGITTLRMSPAYHDRRRPRGHVRADLHVSANIGLTLHATRQSVIDARCCLHWLAQQGYRRLGILGTSLGSCIAFLTAAHEPLLRAGAYNHVSHWFGDVVWTGLATQHVRRSLEGYVSQQQLRYWWAPISPATYISRFAGRSFRSLFIWARHDPVFLPEYSREFLEACREHKLDFEAVALPCGHYTLGRFPFNWADALLVSRFFLRTL